MFHFSSYLHVVLFSGGTVVKNHLPMQEMQETPVWTLEKEMATHSRILAWNIPWTE